MGRFDRATKRLEDSSQNIADALRLAADCESKRNRAGKQVYRGQLQQMIFDYASSFLTADAALNEAVAAWKIRQTSKLRPPPATGPSKPADDVLGELDAAKSETARAVTAARRALARIVDRLDTAADAGDCEAIARGGGISVVHDGVFPEDIRDKSLLDAQKQSLQQVTEANETLAGNIRAQSPL